MGKLVTFLSILIFIDLLFLATGQICARGDCTFTSIIFDAMFKIGDMKNSQIFLELIGNIFDKLSSATGILALLSSGAVLVAYIATKEFRLLLIPMVITFAVLISDFVTISVVLWDINKLLAVFIMSPISIIYTITVVEWFIGKD